MGSGVWVPQIHPPPPCVSCSCVSRASPSAGTQQYCLSFWYHMYGTQLGSLRVSLANDINLSNRRELWFQEREYSHSSHSRCHRHLSGAAWI